jgi:hypothetical protein
MSGAGTKSFFEIQTSTHDTFSVEFAMPTQSGSPLASTYFTAFETRPAHSEAVTNPRSRKNHSEHIC